MNQPRQIRSQAHNNYTMYFFMKKRIGQSLIEVIVAIGIILSVLISIAVLVVINIFGQKSSENMIIASNLAREGIEAVRNIRDTSRRQNITPAFNGAGHFWRSSLNTTNNTWSLLVASGCTNPLPADTAINLVPIGGGYVYNDSASGGVATIFKRLITIDDVCVVTTDCGDGVCENGVGGVCGNSEGTCTVATGRSGYRVKAEIEWLENNKMLTFELVDFLYDWR